MAHPWSTIRVFNMPYQSPHMDISNTPNLQRFFAYKSKLKAVHRKLSSNLEKLMSSESILRKTTLKLPAGIWPPLSKETRERSAILALFTCKVVFLERISLTQTI